MRGCVEAYVHTYRCVEDAIKHARDARALTTNLCASLERRNRRARKKAASVRRRAFNCTSAHNARVNGANGDRPEPLDTPRGALVESRKQI